MEESQKKGKERMEQGREITVGPKTFRLTYMEESNCREIERMARQPMGETCVILGRSLPKKRKSGSAARRHKVNGKRVHWKSTVKTSLPKTEKKK
jgi:hypothetical protein